MNSQATTATDQETTTAGPPTAFALGGLGGTNAHGAGFLAAAQDLARARRALRSGASAADDGDSAGARNDRHEDILDELKLVSCTSGMIASTALYLRGEDLRATLERHVAELDRLLPLPRNEYWQPWKAPLAALLTGVPGVFRPLSASYAMHVIERLGGFLRPSSPWFVTVPTSWTELFDLLLPARLFIPSRPRQVFYELAETFNEQTSIGVAFNSFNPQTGVEHLSLNDAALKLICDHHDPEAEYGRHHGDSQTVYERIDGERVRAALWLLEYGFEEEFHGEHLIDGAYARSVILNELSFAKRIYVPRPINRRWIGRLPRNLLERQDLQLELYFNKSYREQATTMEKINDLLDSERLQPPSDQQQKEGATKYHPIELVEIPIQTQRGFFDYFVESLEVFDAARRDSREVLDNNEPPVALRAGQAARTH